MKLQDGMMQNIKPLNKKMVIIVNNQTKLYTIEDIHQILNPIFEKSGVIKAVLFGSYAKNSARDDSDIDILVEVVAYFKKDMYVLYGN